MTGGFEADGNPNAGGGHRIYTGKMTPSDSEEHKKVKVVAKTTSAKADLNIFLRSIDMDDPENDEAPVDRNGSASGNDNRGAPGIGTLMASVLTTDDQGMGDTVFEVTMNPGDNFAVVGGCNSSSLTGVQSMNSQILDFENNPLPTDRLKPTKMATVWRKLHIEWDEMATVFDNNFQGNLLVDSKIGGQRTTFQIPGTLSVRNQFKNGLFAINGVGYPVNTSSESQGRTKIVVNGVAPAAAGQSYVLVDDDDFNTDDQMPGQLDGDELETVFKLSDSKGYLVGAENVFEPAYIMPVFDGGGSNGDGLVFWEQNIASIDQAMAKQDLLSNFDSAGNGADDFWVVYLRSSYQFVEEEDGDPDNEPLTAGWVPLAIVSTSTWMSAGDVAKGGNVVDIFHEGGKEISFASRNSLPNIHKVAPAHELGHALGLGHDADLMCDGDCLARGASQKFSNLHLNNLRWRVQSPGQ